MTGPRKIHADVLRFDPHRGVWEAWHHSRPIAHATDLEHLRSHCQDGVLVMHMATVKPLVADAPQYGHYWTCTCGEAMTPTGRLETREQATAFADDHNRQGHPQ